jgi:heptosyltransferase II
LKRILFINPFGIGDVLFTFPALRAVREANPGSFIGYWCNERVGGLFQDNPRVNKVFVLSRGDIKKIYQRSRLEGVKEFFGLLRQIKREKFDCAFDFSLDRRYGLIAKILGIRERIGFDYKGRGKSLTDTISLAGYYRRHVVEYYLDLLRLANIEPRGKTLELFVSQESKAGARAMLRENGVREADPVIGMVPAAGASWGKDASLKHWSTYKFAELADKLIAEKNVKVILLGDASERGVAGNILASMKGKAVDFTGKTSIPLLAGLIGSCRLLLANDGGPLHMAVALDVPTVSIFGPVDENVYGPYPPSERHIVVKKALECRPCYQKFALGDCERERECIRSISVDEVYTAIRRLL